ncbi:MAG TPA: hypothetical protein VLC54_04910 [Anaeromyxobacter sp.]|nr:hypothetical protein [Anaeromyxobacter sp.]
MATKAEQFRYWTERSGPKKPKSPPPARRDAPVDTSLAGVSATDRKAGVPRKASGRAGKKAAYTLETSAGKPSRKSTRKAVNRQRTDMKMVAKSRTERVRPPPRGTPHAS